jgi:hypothetical protein
MPIEHCKHKHPQGIEVFKKLNLSLNNYNYNNPRGLLTKKLLSLSVDNFASLKTTEQNDKIHKTPHTSHSASCNTLFLQQRREREKCSFGERTHIGICTQARLSRARKS